MTVQFDTRRDEHGWTVFERETGLPVTVGCASQSGLSFADADDLTHRLNFRRIAGDRSLLHRSLLP
jgi:hypothetical protein